MTLEDHHSSFIECLPILGNIILNHVSIIDSLGHFPFLNREK
ncbi:hypothetical protein PDIG_60340 [Penicillium digitatum PHI26]|uniref:Uncharacterized protein n=2 Tax=Penicillium digitatum TaxID=36651 RepID=K9G8W8_PEND2|nr:hypothetical protein PDIP_69750 [Penicillium digitatum Pd1]EKV08140.1 hypothetical protein PDIP_69750 [Penicillium digitatum Pd1]EKV09711.1 hypothetical protein PDIG_60340 [Penicillium digitatum PHI26]